MKLLISLTLSLMSSYAFAFPQAPVNSLAFNPPIAALDFDSLQYDFEGIVKLSNCSGSLIKLDGQLDSAKALVLTNGHCLASAFGGMLKPGEVVVNRTQARSMKLYKTLQSSFTINATKVIYATMTGTDMTIYELSETYAQIFERTAVAPLILSPNHPQASTEIEVISGYWNRGYSCPIDGFAYQLKEASWTFSDSIRYGVGCDVIGGTSGSPIVERGTRDVIGINNTINESGARCTMNNPCEVSQNGEVTFKKGNGYGQETYVFYTCLDKNFQLDLNLSGCLLAK